MVNKHNDAYEILTMVGEKLEVPPCLGPKLGMAWTGAAIALNAIGDSGLLPAGFEQKVWPKILSELEELMNAVELVEDLQVWEGEFLSQRASELVPRQERQDGQA